MMLEEGVYCGWRVNVGVSAHRSRALLFLILISFVYHYNPASLYKYLFFFSSGTDVYSCY